MSVSENQRLSPLCTNSNDLEERKLSSPKHPYLFRSLSVLSSCDESSPSPSPREDRHCYSPKLPHSFCSADVLALNKNGMDFLCMRLSFRTERTARDFFSRIAFTKEEANSANLKSDLQVSKNDTSNDFTVQIEFTCDRMRAIFRNLFRICPPLVKYFEKNWNDLTLAKN